jgi:hypothetical protein
VGHSITPSVFASAQPVGLVDLLGVAEHVEHPKLPPDEPTTHTGESPNDDLKRSTGHSP